MFLSKNSIIPNQIIRMITFSASDCRARISQYKFLLTGNDTHTHYKSIEVSVSEHVSMSIVAWELLKASLKYFEIQR